MVAGSGALARLVLAHAPADDFRTQAGVFDDIFVVFLGLGTLVGVVVITYLLYNTYTYRADAGKGDDEETPVLGELPMGADKGGRKLFLSFTISAVIVIGLVVWTYSALLYVEAGPANEIEQEHGDEEVIEIEVTARQFIWEFAYPNGEETTNELRVPAGKLIQLQVTSADVWHTFGAHDLRVKADAIPGQVDNTWFLADETGTHVVWCYELCGSGHSEMVGEIIVMEEDDWEDWYAELEEDGEDEDAGAGEDGDEEAAEDESGEEGSEDDTDTETAEGEDDTTDETDDTEDDQ